MRNTSSTAKFFRNNSIAYMFLAPWLLGFFVLTLYPMLYSLRLSFTDYDFTQPDSTQWIGLDNYRKMYGSVVGDTKFTSSTGEVMRVDRYYKKSLEVTFTYVFVSVPLKLIVALAVAVLMNQKLRGVSFYRAVYYIPTLLGGSVAIAVLWRKLFEKDGLVNGFLETFGFSDLPSWITNPEYSLYTLILLTVWQFGSSMIIFLAALKQVPGELYESASIDGMGRVRRFFTITIPLISPMILFNLIMQMINAFQEFTAPQVITGGGPMKSTNLYGLLLYQNGFSFFKMGYASALSWVMFVIIIGFTALMIKSSGAWTFYSDE